MCSYLFVLSFIVFSCKQKFQNGLAISYASTAILAHIYHAELKILVHGLPENNYTKLYNRVSAKYGVMSYQIGGCVISRKLRDSVCVENQKVYKILDKKFGKGWHQKFNAAIESAMYQL